MRKIYTSERIVLAITIHIEDRTQIIKFTGGIKSNALKIPSTYSTYNKEIQDALEKHPLFNDLFFLSTDKDIQEDITEMATATTISDNAFVEKTFKNKQDLIEQMYKLLPDVSTNKRMSNEELISLAKERGYLFKQE